MTKIAILDDYIGVALEYGDWNVLPDDAEITVYRQAIPPERLVEELRERVFDARFAERLHERLELDAEELQRLPE